MKGDDGVRFNLKISIYLLKFEECLVAKYMEVKISRIFTIKVISIRSHFKNSKSRLPRELY